MKIKVNEVGDIEVKLSNRAKYIRLSIDTNGKTSVIIPRKQKIQKAIEFISSKKNWINKTKHKLKRKKKLKLELTHNELKNFKLRTEERLLKLSKKYRFHYTGLLFKTLKSRWGSCTIDNVICLNNLLYHLPQDLQDYIMLHELVHTKIKNHSKVFWDELGIVCKDAKIKRKTLKDNYTIS